SRTPTRPGASSSATSASPFPTRATAAARSRWTTASTACRRRSSSRATARSAPSTSAPSPTRWSVQSSSRCSDVMGGPEMAPHTPQRSERPGKPGPLLEHPGSFRGGPDMAPHTPQRSERPGKPGPLLEHPGSFRGGPEMAPPHTPQRSERPGEPGPLLEHRDSRVPRSAARALAVALGMLLLVVSAADAGHVSEQTVHDVAAELRCVVCQNLSVADSPSEMASQMRAIVRERLEAGETPAQVREYFVERYGEWILLAPRRTGFNLLVWGFPLAAMGVGFTVVALLLRRWTRRRRGRAAP